MNAAASNFLSTAIKPRDPFEGLDPKLVTQTQKWVGETFFGTILKQMRESPFKDQLFSGGRGGDAFGAMYDQRLAEHMSRGVGSKLVRAIARKLEAKKAYQKAQAGSASRESGVQGDLPHPSRDLKSQALNPIPDTRSQRR